MRRVLTAALNRFRRLAVNQKMHGAFAVQMASANGFLTVTKREAASVGGFFHFRRTDISSLWRMYS
jgi:hypothetical protein